MCVAREEGVRLWSEMTLMRLMGVLEVWVTKDGFVRKSEKNTRESMGF